MLQQIPHFLLSRPLTYFGTWQQFAQEDENFSDEEVFELFGFKTEEIKTPTGLFIHWFDT